MGLGSIQTVCQTGSCFNSLGHVLLLVKCWKKMRFLGVTNKAVSIVLIIVFQKNMCWGHGAGEEPRGPGAFISSRPALQITAWRQRAAGVHLQPPETRRPRTPPCSTYWRRRRPTGSSCSTHAHLHPRAFGQQRGHFHRVAHAGQATHHRRLHGNLALADLTFMGSPLLLVVSVRFNNHFSKALCKLSTYMMRLNIYASVFCLT